MVMKLAILTSIVLTCKSQGIWKAPVNVERIDPQEVPESLSQGEVRTNLPFIDPPGFRERFELFAPVAFPRPEFNSQGIRNPIIRADFNPPPGEFPDYFAIDAVTFKPIQGGPSYRSVPRFTSQLPRGEFPLYLPDPRVNEMTGMPNPVFAPFINTRNGLPRYIPFRTPNLPPEQLVFPKNLVSQF